MTGERHACSEARLPAIEPGNDLYPVLCGNERDLDFGDDTVHTVRMVNSLGLLADQIDQARLRLHGRNPDAQDVSRLCSMPQWIDPTPPDPPATKPPIVAVSRVEGNIRNS